MAAVGPEPSASPHGVDSPPPDTRLLALGWIAAALFAAAFLALVTWTPYVRGFDDAEHVRAALLWRDEARLDTEGPFLRVPLWAVTLGTLFRLAPPGVAVALLQASAVLAALALACRHARRLSGPRPLPLAVGLPLLLFALSPQVLLYARHAVNELWIGLLALLVLQLGTGDARGRAAGLGLCCGAAAMTKLFAAALLLPALLFLLRGAPARLPARLGGFLLGAALVVVPLVGLHLAQRGGLPLDNTSAFNLSRFENRDWLALPDHEARRRAGLADFRDAVTADPLGSLAAMGRRLARWLARPATADFALYDPDFPVAAVGLWEWAVLAALLLLAAAGTTRAEAPIWLFLAAIPLACTIPPHVPFTPKLIPVFPCLWLAPRGALRLARGRGAAPG